MVDVFNYKKLYLSSQSFYQFIFLDENLYIKESCNSLFDTTEYTQKPISELFPFLNFLYNYDWEEDIFLPHIDVSLTNLLEDSSLLDFSFFREKSFVDFTIVCVIRDVSKVSLRTMEMQQIARTQMLENEYLLLQNKNIQLENTLLQAKNKELQTSRELKNLFFSKISHELRSPVNGILGLSQIMVEENCSANELNKYVEAIYTAAKHLRTILDDILDLSKLESGKIEFQKRSFKLHKVIEHLQINFTQIIEKKQLYFQTHIDTKIPQILIGDDVRLNQIFYNLISNAIKFTPEKGKITFEATLIQKDEQNCLLQFRVSDTGEGMSEDEQSRIFNPFEQVGSLSYQELGGTGLGLSVVKQLVEMQKGNIQVYSKKDEGSTFVVELPFEIEKVNSTIGQEENLNFVGLTALVVDDSKISQVYAEKLLQSWGFIVEATETGNTALKMLQKKYYDLLLTDINIPDISGDALADLLEEQKPHSEKITIIFATGSSDIRQFKYPILSKPFEPKELWNLLEQTIPKEKTTLYGMEYLLKITEGKTDFVEDMIGSFLQACPEDMKRVEVCIEDKNAEELYKAVHKLKPMAVLMDSGVLTRVLLLIEKLSKQNNNVDWQSIEKYNRIATNVAKSACLFFEKQRNEIQQ